MSLDILADVANKIEDKNKLKFCNGWWNKKTNNFIIKSQYYSDRYLCYNKTSNEFKHIAWNNKPVCLNCILIGNKIIAINYFLHKIFTFYYINNLRDSVFLNLLKHKIEDSCLNKITIPILYTRLTNIYKEYYKNVKPILYAIRLFENNYNPNLCKNLSNNNEYVSMKRLLELSE